MKNEIIYENNQKQIIAAVTAAQKNIALSLSKSDYAVLHNPLVTRAAAGCAVHLIVDAAFENDDLQALEAAGGAVHITPALKNQIGQFAMIIDQKTVFLAPQNVAEEMFIMEDASELSELLYAKFDRLWTSDTSHTPKNLPFFPFDKVVRLLEFLKGFIAIKDYQQVRRAARFLKPYAYHTQIEQILKQVAAENFIVAFDSALAYAQNKFAVSKLQDPEIDDLILELAILERQVNALHNRKVDLDRRVCSFEWKLNKGLRELTLEILQLQKQIAERENNQTTYQKCVEEEETYRKHAAVIAEKEVYEADEAEEGHLRTLFYETSALCDPLKCGEENKKETAAEIFDLLKLSYEINAVRRLRQIADLLKKNSNFRTYSQTTAEKSTLKDAKATLENEIQNLKTAIKDLEETRVFGLITVGKTAENIDSSVAALRLKFEKQAEKLREKLAQITAENDS